MTTETLLEKYVRLTSLRWELERKGVPHYDPQVETLDRERWDIWHSTPVDDRAEYLHAEYQIRFGPPSAV